MTRIIKVITLASAMLAGVTLVYIAVATISSVLLRYVFRQPNRFLFESTEFALPLTVFFVFGLVAMSDRNVRVDLIPQRMERTRHVTDLISRFGTAAIAAALGWFAAQLLVRDLTTGIRMGSTFGLPRWILMLGLVIGLILLAANEFIKALDTARRKTEPVAAIAEGGRV